MVPMIGVMVGTYIITRMLVVMSDKYQHEGIIGRTVIKISAVITILVALVGIITLM